jgi:integrase
MKMFATLEIKEPKGKKKKHPYFNGGLDEHGNKRTYSASTIRRHYFVFKKLVNWGAVQHGFQIDPRVFDSVEPPEAWDGQRERRLSVEEEARLYEAITRGRSHKEAWTSVITFALDTSARMQEILLARWSDIDEANRLWSIPKEHTKTSKARKVPLTLASLECIKTMRKSRDPKSERIFHQWAPRGGLSKAWKRLVARAKIKDLHYHDLRHEATSRLFERTDLKDAEIMKITGHTTHEMLKGYLGLRETSVAARMDAMRRTPPSPATPS